MVVETGSGRSTSNRLEQVDVETVDNSAPVRQQPAARRSSLERRRIVPELLERADRSSRRAVQGLQQVLRSVLTNQRGQFEVHQTRGSPSPGVTLSITFPGAGYLAFTGRDLDFLNDNTRSADARVILSRRTRARSSRETFELPFQSRQPDRVPNYRREIGLRNFTSIRNTVFPRPTRNRWNRSHRRQTAIGRRPSALSFRERSNHRPVENQSRFNPFITSPRRAENPTRVFVRRVAPRRRDDGENKLKSCRDYVYTPTVSGDTVPKWCLEDDFCHRENEQVWHCFADCSSSRENNLEMVEDSGLGMGHASVAKVEQSQSAKNPASDGASSMIPVIVKNFFGNKCVTVFIPSPNNPNPRTSETGKDESVGNEQRKDCKESRTVISAYSKPKSQVVGSGEKATSSASHGSDLDILFSKFTLPVGQVSEHTSRYNKRKCDSKLEEIFTDEPQSSEIFSPSVIPCFELLSPLPDDVSAEEHKFTFRCPNDASPKSSVNENVVKSTSRLPNRKRSNVPSKIETTVDFVGIERRTTPSNVSVAGIFGGIEGDRHSRKGVKRHRSHEERVDDDRRAFDVSGQRCKRKETSRDSLSEPRINVAGPSGTKVESESSDCPSCSEDESEELDHELARYNVESLNKEEAVLLFVLGQVLYDDEFSDFRLRPEPEDARQLLLSAVSGEWWELKRMQSLLRKLNVVQRLIRDLKYSGVDDPLSLSLESMKEKLQATIGAK